MKSLYLTMGDSLLCCDCSQVISVTSWVSALVFTLFGEVMATVGTLLLSKMHWLLTDGFIYMVDAESATVTPLLLMPLPPLTQKATQKRSSCSSFMKGIVVSYRT